MQDSNALPPGGIREQKKTLIERLNERVAHIAKNWYTLAQVNWDPDKLHRLHRYIKDLAADSAKFGLAQVFARIRALKSATEITVRAEARAIENEIEQEISAENRDTTEHTQLVQGIAPDKRAFAPPSRLIGRGHFLEHLDDLISSDKLNFGGILVLELDNLEKLRKESASGEIDSMLGEAAILVATQIEFEDLASRVSDSACAVISRRPTSEAFLALAEQLRRARRSLPQPASAFAK